MHSIILESNQDEKFINHTDSNKFELKGLEYLH